MKLNNKGFTLVELLAVVVILLAISVIAISSISSAMERNKAKQDEAKKEVLESYAKIYVEEHKNSISDGMCILVSDLQTSLDLDESEITDSSEKPFLGGVCYSNNSFQYQSDCDSGCVIK